MFTFSNGGLLGRESALGFATVVFPAKTGALEVGIPELGHASGTYWSVFFTAMGASPGPAKPQID